MKASLRKGEFSPVCRQGRRAADSLLVMYVLENGTPRNEKGPESAEPETRIGITVSKKIGNSVVRSRVKRIIYEAFRLQKKDFRKGLDIVVIARQGTQNLKSTDMEKSLRHLAKRLHILEKTVPDPFQAPPKEGAT